jgi:glucokinase
MKTISIGADIGGSHITTMAVDLGSGQLLHETLARCNVNCDRPATEILVAWKTSLEETLRKSLQYQLTGIGFAMPGPFDYANGIALFKGVNKFESLYGLDIRAEIKSMTGLPGELPVRFLNDATCFAIGEAWAGEASKYRRLLAITLGTGFGSAFLDAGIPISTGDEVPLHGWVYHLPFGNSIADDHFSTRWFIKRFHELSDQTVSGVKEIALAYPANPAAIAIFNEFGKNLGQFLAPLIRNFRTECLVIGGNIGHSYTLFREPFLEGLNANNITGLHVCVSANGEEAAIAGSARLADNVFYNSI